MSPFGIKLDNYIYEIHPEYYLIDRPNNICYISIEKTRMSDDQSSEKYRLGTNFLKNFYTILNYEEDLIGFSVNKSVNNNQVKIY